MKKNSLFIKNFKNSNLRQSDFLWFKLFKEDDYFYNNKRALILGKRFSFYSILKSRVFDRNMVDGLCYGNFYGRQKIIFKRKEKKY